MSIFSFDSEPTLYWLLGFILWIGIGIATILPAFWRKWVISDWAYLLFSSLLVVMMRLPIILFNRELNADESQNLSHAITLRQNLVYWEAVDGTTIGPLDQYILLIPNYLFGLPFDYTLARWVGVGCILVVIVFFYFALQRFTDFTIARLAMLPLTGFLAFTQHEGFVHYTSEHLPLALMAMLFWLFSKAYRTERRYYIRLFLMGLLVGMIPFGKLQAVPPTAIIVFFTWLLIVKHQGKLSLSGDWGTFSLVLGALCFPLGVSVLATFHGVFQDFIRFYIEANASYGSGKPLSESLMRLPIYFHQVNDFYVFSLISFWLFLSLGIVRYRYKSTRPTPIFLWFFAISTLIGSLYAVLKPGNEFSHYLLFLLMPLTLINACFISEIYQRALQKSSILKFGSIALLLLLIMPTIGFLLEKKGVQGSLNKYISTPQTNRQLAESGVSKEIAKYTQQGDYLTVWGWTCKYYVETGLPAGTAENHTERCIFQHQMKDVYKDRFIKDIRRSKPKVFVDAVGINSLWVTDSKTQGYQTWEELRRYIDNNYTLKATIDDSRIFVRNTK
jgi:hypothetical protein